MDAKLGSPRILHAQTSQRQRTEVSPRQRRLAVGLWVVTALVAALVSPGWTQAELPGLLFLIALHSISIAASVRLPGGIYTGLVNTSLVAAALTIGYQRALFVAPLTVIFAALPGFLLMTTVRSLRPYRYTVAFETLWHSSAVTLSLLPVGWLYERLGGGLVRSVGTLTDFGLIGMFIISYFLLTFLSSTLWLWLGNTRPGPYWQQYGRVYVLTGLVVTVMLAPFIATHWHTPLLYRMGGLLPYTLVALALYSVTYTQLNMSNRTADLRALSSIGQVLNANLNVEHLLEAIYHEIDQLLDTSNFYLALVDEPGRAIHFVRVYEGGKPRPRTSRRFQNGLTEHVIRTRRSLLLDRQLAETARELGIEPVGRSAASYLGVPLIAEDKVLGVIGLLNFTQEYAFDEDDQRLLETISASAAVALQNAHLYQQSQRQASELSSLNKVSSLVSTSLDLETVLTTICRVVIDVMNCQKSAVFLIDKDTRTYRLAQTIGLSERYQAASTGVRLDADRRAHVMVTGEPGVIEDVLTDERFRDWQRLLRAEGVRGVLEVPMRTGDEVIGTLVVYYDEPQQFMPRQVELLQTIAGQVSMAVENARLFAATNARRRELETLFETGRVINSSLVLPRVLRTVTTSLLAVLNVDTASVLLVDETQKTLKGEVWMDRSGENITERPADSVQFEVADLSRVRRQASDPESIPLGCNVPEPDGCLEGLAGRFALASGLALPLIIHGELLGLIVIGHREQHAPFHSEMVRLARALADQATIALQNARLFEYTDVALTRRLDELAALEAISQRMARRLDLQAVIEQVVHAAALATNVEVSELLLLNEADMMLEVAARKGEPRHFPFEKWPANLGIVGRALRTGQTIIVNDVSIDPDYVATMTEVKAEMVVPIILDERRLGLINLESVQADAFDQEQARFVSNLAEHAAVAIQNAQLFEAVQQRAEEFQTLRTVAVDLLSSTNLRNTLRVIARHALTRAKAKDVHIYLYDQRTEQLTFGTSLWADGRTDVEFAPPRPDGMTATAARRGQTLEILNPHEHPLFAEVIDDPDWGPIEAMISVPLKRGDEVLGVFNLALEDDSEFDRETMHFLDLLGAQAAVAISNARLTEQTRTGRNRLQAILNSINDGILMFDMAGRLVMANPRVEDLLGESVTDHVGKHLGTVVRRLRKAFQGDDAFLPAETFKLARQIEDDPKIVTRRTYKLHSPSVRIIDEMSLPVTSHDEVIGRLLILRDVTHEHEMETYRQEMSNMLVHDLRSPLAGVITGLHMALDETAYLAEDVHRDMIETSVEVALTSANTLLRLVEQILDVNKLEAGEMALVMEAVDLKALAGQARDMLSGTAAEAGIEIRINAPDNLPPVHADADKIKRVFVNLLDNALRYTPAGGHVRIGISARHGTQTVSIVDTGEGIPAELRERVFERFFQGDTTRRQRGVKGSGLGLTFCRLAVEAHGGRIWVEQGPEGGAAFTFTLPDPHSDRPAGTAPLAASLSN